MIGPQRGPSSSAKIQAESKYIQMLISDPYKALLIAKEAHRGQTRWNGADYFTEHVRTVANIAAYHKDNLPEFWRNNLGCIISAAYLHDVVEDTAMTLEDLSKEFSPLTVEIVKTLTHIKDESYFDYIIRIHDGLYGAQFIKLCDLAHNLNDLDPKRNKNMRDKYKFAQYILEKQVGFVVECKYVR
jgi:(p)ppGpp synthase/HD superfamily hydrolase